MSEKAALSEGQETEENGSVFDFLYHDARRIASFLSQMSAYGALDSINHSEDANKSKVDAGELTAKAGAIIASGTVAGKFSSSSSAGQRVEKSYDPIWSNALNFLDLLEERNLINREISSARIGQFVLMQGEVTIADLALFEGMWKNPQLKKVARNSGDTSADLPRSERRKNKSTGGSKKDVNHVDVAFEIISMLPQTIQMSVRADGSDDVMWGIMEGDCLITPSSSLFFGHGIEMQGRWAVLGILDALPDQSDSAGALSSSMTQPGMSLIVRELFGAMAEPVRNLLGRPEEAHGVTPVLVFREIDQE